jgi:hypothetical protein
MRTAAVLQDIVVSDLARGLEKTWQNWPKRILYRYLACGDNNRNQ